MAGLSNEVYRREITVRDDSPAEFFFWNTPRVKGLRMAGSPYIAFAEYTTRYFVGILVIFPYTRPKSMLVFTFRIRRKGNGPLYIIPNLLRKQLLLISLLW